MGVDLELKRARSRRYVANHPEAIRERNRRYYLAHREEMLERSTHWRVANPEKVREANRRCSHEHPEYSRTRRTKKIGAFVASVSLREIFDRCHGRCHICGGRVRWETAYPDPLSKSIDHLIPLSPKHGKGTHEPSNVALAHLRCNIQRGAGRSPAQLWLLVA